MAKYLVTGGAGFFGGILASRLLAEGAEVVSVDLVPNAARHRALTSLQADIRDEQAMRAVFAAHRFDGVFHIAAMLAHGRVERELLWTSNVDGTGVIARCAGEAGVRKLVFTSSNCLWASNMGRPVREDDPPAPAEVYGESKLEGEKLLHQFADDLDVVILRCPTIIDSGRLGLLAILFEFICENRTVWVVGSGGNRYQFIHAGDLAQACIQALDFAGTGTFHVGSDHVPSLRECYEAVIAEAGSRSRVRSLPKGPALAAMRLAHALKISPLGPYHYRMIAEDFVFDTTRIREAMCWRPTVTNSEMLTLAYRYYAENREEILARKNVSAHSRAAEMGIVRLLKWIS
ncbi:MAG: NAD(P)-dependent oxidoreductase [Terracidiphilus sp.]|jgi:nucleoside-diphosphate-sugar epimerase